MGEKSVFMQVAPYVSKVVIGQDALRQISRIQSLFNIQKSWITTLELHFMPFERLAAITGFSGCLETHKFIDFFSDFPYVIWAQRWQVVKERVKRA